MSSASHCRHYAALPSNPRAASPGSPWKNTANLPPCCQSRRHEPPVDRSAALPPCRLPLSPSRQAVASCRPWPLCHHATRQRRHNDGGGSTDERSAFIPYRNSKVPDRSSAPPAPWPGKHVGTAAVRLGHPNYRRIQGLGNLSAPAPLWRSNGAVKCRIN